MKNTAVLMIIMALAFISSALAEDEQSEGWKVGVGLTYRSGMKLRVRGTSYVQANSMHADKSGSRAEPSRGKAPSSTTDDTTQFADRTFDDGYVFRDAATEEFGGDTWYWGYDGNSQYDSGAGQLRFHRFDSYETHRDREKTSVQTLRNESISMGDDLDALGVEIMAARALPASGALRMELRMGLISLPSISWSDSASPYEERVQKQEFRETKRYSTQTTFSYDLMSVIPPPAPYSGTYDGPGPLLPNRPAAVNDQTVLASSRNELTASSYYSARNEVRLEIDADVYELYWGVSLRLQPVRRVSLSLQPVISLNFIDMTVLRTEDWIADRGVQGAEYLASMRDEKDEQFWVMGAGLRADFSWMWSENWSIELGAGYEWVLDDVEMEVGPNTISFDVGGLSANLLLARQL